MTRLFSRFVFVALLASLHLLGPASVSADAVSMPPSCPEGSTSILCHGPPTCETNDCSTSGCPSGQVCVARNLCVRSHTCCTAFGCSMSEMREHVTGPCGPAGGCRDAMTACQPRRVCVPMTTDAGAVDAGGLDAGGTDAGGTDAGGTDADGGPVDPDGGPADPDAGSTDDDAGPTDADGGSTPMDAGGPTGDVDAGPDGGPTDGGCCNVSGEGRSTGGLFVTLLVCAVVVIRRRRG